MSGVRRGLLLLVAVMAAPGPAAAQQTHAVIVAGLGGQEPYRTDFRTWAVDLKAALEQRHGVPDGNVVVLAEDPAAHPAIHDRSTRANVLKVLGELAARVAPDDRVAVVLIGHGTAQGGVARLNLPGPDLTPEDLAAASVAFPTQSLALIHTGSASGGFVGPLAGANRVIIAATRTERERNATEFPRFFVEAVAGDGADLDKDGRVSLLEAFEFSVLEVARYYDEQNEILTEHAVLEDDGDGEGSRQPIRDGSGDGAFAAAFHLGTGPGASAATAVPTTADPQLARLYEERRLIQERLDALRSQKDSMSETAYEDALEILLVELALKVREIRAREGGGA